MKPGTTSQSREIHGRPDIGLAAHVIQGNELRIARIHLERDALILVDRGIKTVTTGQLATVNASPGQAIVLRGNQTVDFTNAIALDGTYEARWLLFDNALLQDERLQRDAALVRRTAARRAQASIIRKVAPAFGGAFDTARAALALSSGLPDAIARLRVLEIVYWLLEHGIVLEPQAAQSTTAARIRALVSGDVQTQWSSAFISGHLAMSEATLRRRLSAEGTSLTDVIADVRMSTALTLLQATSRPVAEIALSVGYESPSRFAVRFRERFGFSPSTVRDHVRTGTSP